MFDGIKYLVFVMRIERREANNKLIKQSPKAVVVQHVVMSLLLHHLRRHIFMTPAERIGFVSFTQTDFSQSEISKDEMSVTIHHDIFRFDIAIENLVLMQILKSQQYLNKIELGFGLGQLLKFPQMIKELSSWAILIS